MAWFKASVSCGPRLSLASPSTSYLPKKSQSPTRSGDKRHFSFKLQIHIEIDSDPAGLGLSSHAIVEAPQRVRLLSVTINSAEPRVRKWSSKLFCAEEKFSAPGIHLA
jgi:hypothetical protein